MSWPRHPRSVAPLSARGEKWLVALAALVGCAAGNQPPQAPSVDVLAQRPESFVARVARLRELSELRPTPVVFDDEATFHAVADRKSRREAIQPTPIDFPAVQLSLGLVFAAKGAAPAQSFGALHRSQMIAFYDEFEHQIHVRARARDDADLPFVVAHELGHSLQFQHFHPPEVANVIDEDARLARLSLLEGDAMLTMAAFAADEHHVPLSRALVKMADGALEANLQGYKAALEQSPELGRAAPFQRERLMFPYQTGASFMAQLHRAGGFALVNRVYGAPPASTEHILHPEKYLAGELPVPVRAPAAVAGWESLRSGHVGELLLRAMLDVCNERAVSHRAAAGWGGDAFTVLKQGERGALLLATTWDSETDAQEFERALRTTAGCWDRAPAATREIFRGSAQVLRQGTSVGLSRGLPLPTARKALVGLPELVGRPIAAVPPFGAVAIPPIRRAPPVPHPFVQNQQVIAPRLGLSIPILAGLVPRIEQDDVSFRATDAGHVSLIFAISDLAYSRQSVSHTFDTFEHALKQPLDADQHVSVLVREGTVSTPVGKAVERVWQVDETPIRGRMMLVPICRGTGMLVIGQGYGSDETRALLDRVVAGLRVLPTGSPICAELDP
jgi:hypothetical protein